MSATSSSLASSPASAEPSARAAEFAANMARITQQSQRIWQEFGQRHWGASWGLGHAEGAEARAPFQQGAAHITSVMTQWASHMASDPARLIDLQLRWWQDTAALWQSSMQKFLGADAEPVIHADAKDRRFRDKAWQENVVFDFIRQSYLLTARWMQQSVQDTEGVEPAMRRKIEFYTRQFIDAMSPSNFFLTNPEVLKATLASNGQNLVKGLQHLIDDLEKEPGTLRVSMTDVAAFEVGGNLAVTEGSVVFQNELMQLIQYAPLTEKVHQVPLLIIPPWINKYYVLDLQPENSMVRWLCLQGYTVFVVSWVNPGKELAHIRFDDYMSKGALAALDAIRDATGEPEASVIGYCLGGTLLASTLSYLHTKKEQKRVRSATYFTTMIDFSEAGELAVFIDDAQLQALETRLQAKGYLDGSEMAATFNSLRANDLIWSFVVNNYLLGKDPFPFDLLYWNADSTRMPATMHAFYLRNMYQKNLLAQPGGLTLCGAPMHLEAIATPSYLLSTREDHIAPWKSTYEATRIYKGPMRFVLAASGHIAGVVNPPAKKKYSYWTKDALPASADAWFDGATEHPGSWWEDWVVWNAPYQGKPVPARRIGAGKLKPLEAAPGSYARVKG